MAPCFSGVELRVLESDQGLNQGETVETIGWTPYVWAEQLAGRHVGVLVCSGVDAVLWGELQKHGIQVVPNAVGDPEAVLRDWRGGQLPVPDRWPCYPPIHVGGRTQRGPRFRRGLG